MEEEEGWFGVWFTYLVCGLGGCVASYLTSPHTRTLSMGASAAVFGLFMVGVSASPFSFGGPGGRQAEGRRLFMCVKKAKESITGEWNESRGTPGGRRLRSCCSHAGDSRGRELHAAPCPKRLRLHEHVKP